jgi:hypothetical protein
MHATLLHLVFITIFVFIEPLLILIVTLALGVSNTVLVQQWLYLACGFIVVRHSPVTSYPI